MICRMRTFPILLIRSLIVAPLLLSAGVTPAQDAHNFDPVPPAPAVAARTAYRAFVEAVRREDPNAIRAATTPLPPQSSEFVDLIVDQLVTFRQFERVAHEKLGKAAGDLGFGLDDDALQRRMLELPKATFIDSRLVFRPRDPESYSAMVGFGADVAMSPAGEAMKVDLLRETGGTAIDFLLASKPPGGPPGARTLGAYRAAVAELEAGRIATRAALEQFIDREIKRADSEYEDHIAKIFDHAGDAEVVQARESAKSWMIALQANDVAAMKRLTGCTADEAAARDRAVEQFVVMNRLARATGKLKGFPDDPIALKIEQTLSRIPTARLMVLKDKGTMGMLRSTRYDRFIATTRPWRQAGIGGPPPEQLNMEKSDGTWRISLQMILKESVQQFMRTQHEDAGDVMIAGLDAEIQRVEHGEVVEYSQFVQRLQALKKHVDDVARTRHLQARKDQEERLLAWRASTAGKAAIIELTAAGSRLQLRLVLREDEAGEFDVMKNPLGGGQLRVSREIMLNEKAFASASVGPSMTDGRPVVQATMTNAGANQMEWVTSNHINHGLAIIFDGKLITAPNIRSTIRNALVIDGGVAGFEKGEPERIVAAIRGGK
jgi:hypothetical protein